MGGKRPPGCAGAEVAADHHALVVDKSPQCLGIVACQPCLDEVLVARAAAAGRLEQVDYAVLRHAATSMGTFTPRSAALAPASSRWMGTPSGAATVPADSAPAISSDTAKQNAASGSSKAMTRPSDRKSTRLNSSHRCISYAVFCL